MREKDGIERREKDKKGKKETEENNCIFNLLPNFSFFLTSVLESCLNKADFDWTGLKLLNYILVSKGNQKN